MMIWNSCMHLFIQFVFDQFYIKSKEDNKLMNIQSNYMNTLVYKFILLFQNNFMQAKTKQTYSNIRQKITKSKNPKEIYLNFLSVDDDIINILLDQTAQVTQRYHLIANNITHQGVKYFQNRNLSSLQFLSLFQNKIGDKGCKIISNLHMPSLKELGLGDNQINCCGVLHLSKGIWNQLIKLQLQKNRVKINSINHLAHGNWKHLSQLLLNEDQIKLRQMNVFVLIEANLTNLSLRMRYPLIIYNILIQKFPNFKVLGFVQRRL